MNKQGSLVYQSDHRTVAVALKGINLIHFMQRTNMCY